MRWTRRRHATALLLSLGLAACDRVFPYQPRPAPGVDALAIGRDGAADSRRDQARPHDGPRPDGPAADSAPPQCASGALLCGGSCVAAADCAGCAAAKLLCAQQRACLTSCTSCGPNGTPTAPIECFACATNQKDPIGTCQPADAARFCLDGDYRTAYHGAAGEHCDCSDTDVANCLAPSQVCLPQGSTDWCVTCGEQGQPTDGKPCKGGGMCRATLTPPRCQ